MYALLLHRGRHKGGARADSLLERLNYLFTSDANIVPRSEAHRTHRKTSSTAAAAAALLYTAVGAAKAVRVSCAGITLGW